MEIDELAFTKQMGSAIEATIQKWVAVRALTREKFILEEALQDYELAVKFKNAGRVKRWLNRKKVLYLEEATSKGLCHYLKTATNKEKRICPNTTPVLLEMASTLEAAVLNINSASVDEDSFWFIPGSLYPRIDLLKMTILEIKKRINIILTDGHNHSS